MTPAVEVTGLRKFYGPTVALDGVDLRVGAGTVHGLLGPNGAGKSTLLRVLLGLVTPDAGTVCLLGEERATLDAPPAKVAGFVDRPHFYGYLSARRNLQLLAELDGLGRADAIQEVLETVGLTSVAGRKVAGWSTGMIQRLGIAAALLRAPALLILDEPTEGLDPAGRRDVRALIRACREQGTTVLVSSHDMAEVETVCDDVTVLARGRVARSAPLATLREEASAGSFTLHTADDEQAAELARSIGLTTTAVAGGLTLTADLTSVDAFVCALGRANVPVRELRQDQSPLTALFFRLTEQESA